MTIVDLFRSILHRQMEMGNGDLLILIIGASVFFILWQLYKGRASVYFDAPFVSNCDADGGSGTVYHGSRGGSFLQLIDGNGTFNVTGIDNFIKQVKLADCGVSYAVVSIMGPQSSGKSTLLNHLFGTNFKEMNAYNGRSQTTKGIWLANCVGIEPCTLVMDMEGTDGRERGQDDTTFEKQSALFAIAVSDIVLLNMWCHEIGREQAANKPLIRIVFQVMIELFNPRKVTLMFVIRDKSKTPWDKLDSDLRKDIQMIWDSVPKPQAHKHTPLSEFFNVQVVAFSNYESAEDQFKNEVASLRQQFFHSIAPGRLAGDRRGVIPASGFSLSVKRIWEIIKEYKELNLPKHKVVVAAICCEEISKKKFDGFSQNKDWCKVEADVKSGPVSGFGMKVDLLLNTCLSEYDAEVTFYDEDVRNEKREQLKEKLMELILSAYKFMIQHIESETLLEFNKAFGEALLEGKTLAEAVSYCTKSSMTGFEKRCADAKMKQANKVVLSHYQKVRDNLQKEIDGRAARVSSFLKEAEEKRKLVRTFIIGVTTIVQGGLVRFPGIVTSAGDIIVNIVDQQMERTAIKKAMRKIS